MACRQLGKTMKFEEADSNGKQFDALAYAISKNLHRRHLDATQRGIAAARAQEIFEEKAADRRKATLKQGDEKPAPVKLPERGESGDARDEAGKAFRVSGSQVDKASKVISQGAKPLVDACERGEISLNAAEKLVAAVPDKRDQAEVVSVGKKAILWLRRQ